MKKIVFCGAVFMILMFIGMSLSASPETERVKKCRPLYLKCDDAARKTSNPVYKGMERDARNAAMKVEREKCKKAYDECK